jgi:hypothetical protein
MASVELLTFNMMGKYGKPGKYSKPGKAQSGYCILHQV